MLKTKAKNSSHQIDMLNGSLAKSMLVFALPLAASTILAQLFNAADVAVAGNFAGSAALAAVGANAPIVSLFVSILSGLALGSNVIIARLVGEGNKDRISTVIHTAISLSIVCGIIMLIAGTILAEPLLLAIDTPKDVLDQAMLYLHIYCFCLPFIMFYNFGAAILRSIGDTRRPLFILFTAGVINVGLNLIFVIVFKMGVSGVAYATLISNIISSLMILSILLKEEEPFRLHLNKLRFDKKALLAILKIGAPADRSPRSTSVSFILCFEYNRSRRNKYVRFGCRCRLIGRTYFRVFYLLYGKFLRPGGSNLYKPELRCRKQKEMQQGVCSRNARGNGNNRSYECCFYPCKKLYRTVLYLRSRGYQICGHKTAADNSV